ncbi:hypothetical protein B0H13DRAFT_2675514 [Mycena leptocephala]|nr:hypothetical protein B0H13DRAFT_2675514 [Mycena leptocephala]
MCTYLPAPQMYEHSNTALSNPPRTRTIRQHRIDLRKSPVPHTPASRMPTHTSARIDPPTSTRSDLHQLLTEQVRRRVNCASSTLARSSQTSREVHAQSCTSPVPSHAETSTPHARIRICAIAIAYAHARSSRSPSLYARLQSPAPHPTCGAFPEHFHSRPMHPPSSRARRPLPRRVDSLPAARRDIHGARRLAHQHPAQELARLRVVHPEEASSVSFEREECIVICGEHNGAHTDPPALNSELLVAVVVLAGFLLPPDS